MFLVSSMAMAKDNELKQRMIDLERVYISALSLTSAKSPMAYPAMDNYVDYWISFSEDYKTYRSSYRNWISYFMHVEELIAEASDLVAEAKASELVDEEDALLVEAHEVLEEIRTTMEEFRGRNGFPKFIADEFTAFHSIMGEIIGISSNPGTTFDNNTIAILDELYNEASHAWFKVEKNTVDQNAWVLSDGEMQEYSDFILAERVALDNFDSALSSGIPPNIKMAALGLKPNQAKAYLLLADLENYQP